MYLSQGKIVSYATIQKDTENTYGYDKKPIIKINQNNFYVFNISNATDLVCADTYASFLDKKANDNKY